MLLDPEKFPGWVVGGGWYLPIIESISDYLLTFWSSGVDHDMVWTPSLTIMKGLGNIYLANHSCSFQDLVHVTLEKRDSEEV